VILARDLPPDVDYGTTDATAEVATAFGARPAGGEAERRRGAESKDGVHCGGRGLLRRPEEAGSGQRGAGWRSCGMLLCGPWPRRFDQWPVLVWTNPVLVVFCRRRGVWRGWYRETLR
jgi:hypothetical protein